MHAGTGRGAGRARPALRSPDADIRSKACRVLQEIGGRETLTFMQRARPDADMGVRIAAQDAMKAIVGRVGPL